jgi:cob(I)alamin adenosyltransferase
LHKIQENLIQVNALFATDCIEWDEKIGFNTALITELENKIDEYQETLEPITCFLIPGTSKINALCNVVRTICRRAERQIYHIELLPCQLSATAYINRLSDYFFVLGRKF